MRAIRWCLMLVLVGCAGGGDDPVIDLDTIDDDITKIINGRFTFERPEVGLLNWNGSACTGTLIRDNVVLTAAHCVGWSTNDARGRPLGSFIVHRGNRETFQFAFDAHISYGQSFEQGGDTDTDIALLRLIQRVPAQVATPVPIADRQPAGGEAVTLFGYGCGDRNNTGDANQGRKQKLPFQQGRTTNLCPGDSGGPTFVGADGPVFQVNSAYNTVNGTDLFGDVVRMAGTLDQQATAWAGNAGAPQGQAPEPQAPQGEGLTCRGLFECLTECGQDQDCAQQCAVRTRAEPRRRYDAMVACSNANRCPDMNCVQRECPGQVQSCFDELPGDRDPEPDPNPQPDPGGDPAPEPQGGDLTCSDLLECGQRCGGDRACFAGCWAQGAPDAQRRYQAYSACYAASDCRDAQCAQQRCGAEYGACTGRAPDNGGGGGGRDPGGQQLACPDVAQCARGCSFADTACIQHCFFQGSFEAQLAFGALATCGLMSLCADDQCLSQMCAQEHAWCYQGGFAGAPDGGCPNGGCPNGGCPNGGGANGGGANGGGANGGCPNGGCPDGGCPDGGCPNGGCPNNVANGPGYRCIEIIDCFGACNDDACLDRCYASGTAEGRSGVDAVYDCADRNGCRDFGCVEQRCGAEMARCL